MGTFLTSLDTSGSGVGKISRSVYIPAMPELPEVETVVRDLRAAGLAGRRIRRVAVRHPDVIAGATPRAFARRVTGRIIAAIERRAKFIVFRFQAGGLLTLHLRMTGHLHLVRRLPPRDRHDHLRLTLDDGRTLIYRDPRRFGRWRLATDDDAQLRRLGPEPLEGPLTAAAFAQRLARHRRQLKPLLLDQTFLAGLGNIYVDEALWAARLHPQRLAHTVRPAAARALWMAIRRVLRGAIRHRGTTLGLGEGNFTAPHHERGQYRTRLQAYGRTGAPCPRCGVPLCKIVVAQRGTHLCPRCQVM
ncbi:MAG: bifunctional DNA-formamidopyrimidine glycosylase/DNA-(apurinic or apyrimidinic site) lyase [Kiritimatiellaeota bacterium]|nr:bifunctional DNA-formamidopyrimidine glycosylase/DNA-(apurinic or apyrimidinic site) lyase [Kiritimatiellota bacterium]